MSTCTNEKKGVGSRQSGTESVLLSGFVFISHPRICLLILETQRKRERQRETSTVWRPYAP